MTVAKRLISSLWASNGFAQRGGDFVMGHRVLARRNAAQSLLLLCSFSARLDGRKLNATPHISYLAAFCRPLRAVPSMRDNGTPKAPVWRSRERELTIQLTTERVLVFLLSLHQSVLIARIRALLSVTAAWSHTETATNRTKCPSLTYGGRNFAG